MSVNVNIPLFLQHLTGVKTTSVNGSTVGECLSDLVRQFPQVKKSLFTTRGGLHVYIDIYVNGAGAYPDELARPVKDGDELDIVHIIAGG